MGTDQRQERQWLRWFAPGPSRRSVRLVGDEDRDLSVAVQQAVALLGQKSFCAHRCGGGSCGGGSIDVKGHVVCLLL